MNALPCMRVDSPRRPVEWPERRQIMVVDGNVLLVSSEQDGPGEPHTLSHSFTLADGREGIIPWTSFKEMTREDFTRWLRLGMPGRQGRGALDSKQLIEMERAQAA